MWPEFINWRFIANDVSAATLDVKAAIEKENKTKFVLIAVGTIAALFFVLLIAKRGK
ncbi:MAG: hypothetical protein MUP81_01935 [Dehalococcoidia bacterium]|nr:hypothetical protein [Dehalococcoidia bacterium]